MNTKPTCKHCKGTGFKVVKVLGDNVRMHCEYCNPSPRTKQKPLHDEPVLELCLICDGAGCDYCDYDGYEAI